jgi:hypothetical protein
MLHAIAFAFPRLQRSRDWKTRLATVRDALRPSAAALGEILKEAARRGAQMTAELAG